MNLHDLVPVFIIGFIVLGIYKVIEVLARRKERMAIIERLPAMLSNNEVGNTIQLPNIFFGKSNSVFSSLRMALLLMGIGLGCMIAFFVEYGLRDNASPAFLAKMEDISFVIYFAFITIFGGLGLFLTYWIESKKRIK
ncbi:MAG: hypothetical protein LBN18_02285 [Dysgonamonadaceae bacterium]|jgi:hypothetical protein|nr:hypothetical protein [Dysgonamonadaceae bacterium]